MDIAVSLNSAKFATFRRKARIARKPMISKFIYLAPTDKNDRKPRKRLKARIALFKLFRPNRQKRWFQYLSQKPKIQIKHIFQTKQTKQPISRNRIISQKRW